MFDLPDHPDIANALRTGYPQPEELPTCNVCGAIAQCWAASSGYRCFECARDEFSLLDDEEAVEKLGFEVLYDV